MSTILEALRKVERERESPREQVLHVSEQEPRPRRRASVVMIVVCAVLGFAAGVGLAVRRGEPPVEIAALPSVPPPPVIDVPMPPGPVRPAPAKIEEPPARSGEAAAARREVTGAADASSAPPPAESANAALGAGERVAATSPPNVATEPNTAGSALEPSPFAAAREAAPVEQRPDARVAAVERDLAVPAAGGAAAPPLPAASEVPPSAATEAEPPAPEAEPEAEPPAEAPKETRIDTGRSPPGAPKVALSFLQWSADPQRRFAFISIEGAPSQRVREGDSAGGLTVAQITPTGVQFRREGTIFTIRPRH